MVACFAGAAARSCGGDPSFFGCSKHCLAHPPHDMAGFLLKMLREPKSVRGRSQCMVPVVLPKEKTEISRGFGGASGFAFQSNG